jgi:putative transcriptional regulator
MDIRRAAVAVAAGMLLAGSPVAAQTRRAEDLAQGKILITPRDSPDPHFSNSVIILAHYDQTGAFGLMLHYKSDLTIQRAPKGVAGAEKRTDPVYVGGPVNLPTVFGLLRAKSAPTGVSQVKDDLYLATSKTGIAAMLEPGHPESDLRIFIGYSGWGPGQLEREVRLGGWFIFDYDERLVFDDHPDTLWNRLIEKTERRLAVLRMFPYTSEESAASKR